MRIYLAHPIADRHWVRQLEVALESETGIELFNPFYDSTEAPLMVQYDSGERNPYDPVESADTIVHRDMDNIKQSDGIIGMVTESWSQGVPMELMWVFLERRDFVFPIGIVAVDARARRHPWLEYVSRRQESDWGIWYTLEHLVRWAMRNPP